MKRGFFVLIALGLVTACAKPAATIPGAPAAAGNYQAGWSNQNIQVVTGNCVNGISQSNPEVPAATIQSMCSCFANLIATQYSFNDVSNNNFDATIGQQDIDTCYQASGI